GRLHAHGERWARGSSPHPRLWRDLSPRERGEVTVPLAEPPLRCYIGPARLRRASGANISPGPYRSFRELSLAGSVDPDLWCPPTFVGNSGIAVFNGDRGFALLLVLFRFIAFVAVHCLFPPSRFGRSGGS